MRSHICRICFPSGGHCQTLRRCGMRRPDTRHGEPVPWARHVAAHGTGCPGTHVRFPDTLSPTHATHRSCSTLLEMAAVGKSFALSGSIRGPPGRSGPYVPPSEPQRRGNSADASSVARWHASMGTLGGSDPTTAEEAPAGHVLRRQWPLARQGAPDSNSGELPPTSKIRLL